MESAIKWHYYEEIVAWCGLIDIESYLTKIK